MTPKEFEDLLVRTRAELSAAFKHGEVKDIDAHTKIVLDYHQIVARALFDEFYKTQVLMTNLRGDIIKDNRERFRKIMEELNKKD